jgi:4-hydroxy-4-methyl-2-oxoglutarate aldolase
MGAIRLGTVKATPGSVNTPVLLGEQEVNAGDVICCDDDGVVIVARSDADDALQLSRARVVKEAESRSRLATGELGVDIYDMRTTLSQLGVVYVDSISELDEDG